MKLNYYYLLPLLLWVHNATAQQSKPNILWITIEDTSPQFIGAYGNADTKTPTIDSLANAGIKFTNAFSTGTVCSPSRSCIITGVKTYKAGTGHHRSLIPLPNYIKGFPYFLRQQGYFTSNNRKTDYNVANEKAFIAEAWNESSPTADWSHRKAGQPFFAVHNYMTSHQSRTMSWDYDVYQKNVYQKLKPAERIADTAFKMPPIYRDSPEMRRQFARVYNSLKLTDKEIGELLTKLKTNHLADSTIIFFFGDHGEGMPRGKTNGISFGYRVPFVIVFPPMYAHLSPWGKAGTITDELIDFEDLAPTLISLAGGKKPDYLTGRTFIGNQRSTPVDKVFLSSDRSDNGPDLTRSILDKKFAYHRNFMTFEPEERYIRFAEIAEIKQQIRKDHKAGLLNQFQSDLLGTKAPESLYDLENDPWEMNNLADAPGYRETLLNYRKELYENIVKERDILLLPEYETHLIAKTQNLYEFRLKDKNYPIAKICEAAFLAGFTDQQTLNKQLGFLSSKNKFQRYWALLGLMGHTAKNIQKHNNVIVKAMADDYPPNAVLAAIMAFNYGNNPQAKALLMKTCSSDNMDLALIAINSLLYCNHADDFIETIKAVKANRNISYDVSAACNDFLGQRGLVPNNMKNEG